MEQTEHLPAAVASEKTERPAELVPQKKRLWVTVTLLASAVLFIVAAVNYRTAQTNYETAARLAKLSQAAVKPNAQPLGASEIKLTKDSAVRVLAYMESVAPERAGFRLTSTQCNENGHCYSRYMESGKDALVAGFLKTIQQGEFPRVSWPSTDRIGGIPYVDVETVLPIDATMTATHTWNVDGDSALQVAMLQELVFKKAGVRFEIQQQGHSEFRLSTRNTPTANVLEAAKFMPQGTTFSAQIWSEKGQSQSSVVFRLFPQKNQAPNL